MAKQETNKIWVRQIPNGKPFAVTEELAKIYLAKKLNRFEVVVTPATPETVEALKAAIVRYQDHASKTAEILNDAQKRTTEQSARITELETELKKLKKSLS